MAKSSVSAACSTRHVPPTPAAIQRSDERAGAGSGFRRHVDMRSLAREEVITHLPFDVLDTGVPALRKREGPRGDLIT